VGAFRWSWIALLALLVPAAASARIYKWTDESGRTVYADAPPAKASTVHDLQVVVDDDAPVAVAAKEAEARARQRDLEERIARLERELAASRYAAPVQYAPPPPPAYYPGYDYSGAYYPYPYIYPSVVIVRPVHRFVAPRFAPRPLAFRHR
jgi:hypothetical protein